MILALLVVLAASAGAAQTHLYETSFDGAGEAPAPLSGAGGLAVVDAPGPDQGDVYVGDFFHDAVYLFDQSGGYLSQITGAETPQGSFTPFGVALDESTGDIYVADTDEGVIDKFDPAGKLVRSFADEGQLTHADLPIPGSFQPIAVAVDPETGELYVGNFGAKEIDVFSSTGDYLRQFSSDDENANQLAIDAEGDLFVSGSPENIGGQPSGIPHLRVYSDATGQPARGYGGGTGILGTGSPAGAFEGVALDPATGDIYAAETSPEGQHVDEYAHGGALVSRFGRTDLGPNGGVRGIGVDDSASHIYFDTEESVAVFALSAVPLPDAATTEATDLAATSATLDGSVDPEGIEVTGCFFEYGETEAYGQTAPCVPAAGAIGSGTEPVQVSAAITGVTAATAYHYRLVAADENGAEQSSDQIFGEPPHVDATSTASVTSDAAELQARIDPGGVIAAYHFEYLTQAAYQADGESFSGLEPATSVPVPDAAIASSRTDQAVSQPISGLIPETTYYYRAVAVNSAAPGGVAGPAKVLITHSTAPEAGLPDDRAYELVSPGAKTAPGGVYDFYFDYLSAENGFRIQATEDGSAITYTGEDFFRSPDGATKDQYTSFRGPDGWSTRNTTGEGPEESFSPLSPPEAPAAPVLPVSATAAAQVVEEAAGGSIVFFLDPGRLTGDSTAAPGEPDLYRYEIENEALTDLTVDGNAGESADVQGVLGVGGEGGSYVYFVADGILGSGGASRGDCVPHAEGSNPPGAETAGTTCNLYLAHDGGISFIASLSARDNQFITAGGIPPHRLLHDWAPEISIRTAEVSPNGRYLAFPSHQELTGQAAAGLPEFPGSEIYRYDAQGPPAGRLVCASCNPDGSTSPTAFLLEPGGAGGLRQHYVADDGRVFFNDFGPLVAADVDGHIDVYEFEDDGTGSCRTSGGCRSLISAGTGSGDSLLAAVSTEGDDVFFTSNRRLTSEDHDESLDIYDARTEGRMPPVPPASCEVAEACHGPAGSPPAESTPGTAGFHGSGNPVEKTCKNGFVKKHGKCIKKPSKHHAHKKHHKKKGHSKHKRAGSKHGGHK